MQFAIRHQVAGVVLGALYDTEPDACVVAAAKARLDELYGVGWARAVPVEPERVAEYATHLAQVAPRTEAPRVEAPAGRAVPKITISARGTVTPPR